MQLSNLIHNQSQIVDSLETIKLPIIIIKWEDVVECQPAIRNIPNSSVGQYLDKDTYVIPPLQIDMDCRFTNVEKEVINTIFNTPQPITIYLLPKIGNSGWQFYGWIREKNISYEYIDTTVPDAIGVTTRWWKATTRLDIQNFTFYSNIYNGVIA